MKKYLATGMAVMLLFPALSFAATTTPVYSAAYIASLEQLLTLLEAELQQVLAQQNAVPAVAITTPVLIAKQGATTPTVGKNGAVYFTESFTVTPTETVDIPQDSTGVQYGISNLVDNASASVFTVSCPSTTVYDGNTYCEIPPNETATFTVNAAIPSTDVQASKSPQLTIRQLKYYTKLSADNPVYSYYQTAGLSTPDYVSYFTGS